MLGAEADADEARGEAAQDVPAAQQPERQRQRQRPGAAEHAADDAVLDQQLHALDEARRRLAPTLHLIERLVADVAAAAQARHQDVGGGDRILDGEVDADAADRRHGVRRVADAQEARPVPAAQAVDSDGEQLDVAPVAQLLEPRAVERGEPGDLLAQGGEAALADLLEAALADDEGALPVIAAVEHHQDAAGVDAAQRLRRGVRVLGNTHPQHVDRRAEIDDLEPRLLPQSRMAAIRADDEAGADVQRAARRWRGGTRHSAVLRQYGWPPATPPPAGT